MTHPPLEIEFPNVLKTLRLPPLHFRLISREEEHTIDTKRLDAVLEVCGERLPATRFAVEYKRQWTPKIIAAAVAEAEGYARKSGLLPLVVLPYLGEETLLDLEERGVSGLDLCGNGVIVSPGSYTVFRTGSPNRFKTSAPIKNVYRGTTSLVSRAFLRQPTFTSVSALHAFIEARGGSVSRPTVSKALQAMEDDLLIRRKNSSLELLQADKLLGLLEKNFLPAVREQTFVGRCSLPLPQVRQILAQNARTHQIDGDICATGISSAPRYATLAMEDEAVLYCRNHQDVEMLLEGLPVEQTTRFPNLRFLETDDPTVFFDRQNDSDSYPWASPVQTYLEMINSEPRLKQSAPMVRDEILRSLRNEEEQP